MTKLSVRITEDFSQVIKSENKTKLLNSETIYLVSMDTTQRPVSFLMTLHRQCPICATSLLRMRNVYDTKMYV